MRMNNILIALNFTGSSIFLTYRLAMDNTGGLNGGIHWMEKHNSMNYNMNQGKALDRAWLIGIFVKKFPCDDNYDYIFQL